MPKSEFQVSSRTQRPQKLLIVTQFFPPDFAATGQLIEELSRHLGLLGVNITVFTGQPGYAFQKDFAPPQEQQQNVTVRRSRVSRLWPHRIRGKAVNSILFCIRAVFYLLSYAKNHDILLLTTAPPYLNILGYLIHCLTGIPYVCLIYDLYPDIAVELHVIQRQHPLARCWHWLNRKIWKKAHRLIVLSSTMKDRVVSHCPEVGDRISIIHNWAEPDWIIPLQKQDNWFAHHHQLHQTFTVLYSGNLGRCHDVETIMQSVEALRDESVQFVFIGGGAQQPLLIEHVCQKNLTNCLFLAYQDRNALPYSLTACDLALVSIKAGMEGLIAPSKVYSALAAARPIVAICDADSYLTELLETAQCGRTFRHGDSAGLAAFIRDLMAHPEQAAEMGIAGRRYLQRHFTPTIIAQQYLQALHTPLPVDVPLPLACPIGHDLEDLWRSPEDPIPDSQG